jgi:hypothetical protein
MINKKTLNLLFALLAYLALIFGLLIIIILGVSFLQTSGGKYIEVWAKDYAPLIAALGVLIATGLASITAHKAIASTHSLENDKRQYEAKYDIENIASMMINIDIYAKYFSDLFSKDFVQAYNDNPDSVNIMALSIIKELKNNATTELEDLWQVKVSKKIPEKIREEFRVAIFAIRERLIRIKIHTAMLIEINTIHESDFVLLTKLLKEISDYAIIPSVKNNTNI